MTGHAIASSSFLQRQFDDNLTARQLVFDIAFGVVAPVMCFLLDPAVFHSHIFSTGMFAEYQSIAYLLSGFEVVILTIWLAVRQSVLNNFVGGVLLAGGVFSALMGTLLIPLSLIGLTIGIGILGFIPFVTSFVYFRNGYRAVAHTRQNELTGRAVNALLLGSLLTLTGSFSLANGINRYIETSISEIVYGDEQHALAAARRIRLLTFLDEMQLDRIVDEYLSPSTQDSRKLLLATCYTEATGEDIANRVHRFYD